MWKVMTFLALALFYAYPTVSDEGNNDFTRTASINVRYNPKHVC